MLRMNRYPVSSLISPLEGTVWVMPRQTGLSSPLTCHLQCENIHHCGFKWQSICLQLTSTAPQAPLDWTFDFFFLSDPEFGRASSWGPSVASVSLLPPSASFWSVLCCGDVAAPWLSSSSHCALYSEHPAVQGSDKDKTTEHQNILTAVACLRSKFQGSLHTAADCIKMSINSLSKWILI